MQSTRGRNLAVDQPRMPMRSIAYINPNYAVEFVSDLPGLGM